MSTDSGGYAFPHDEKTGDGRHWYTHSGMTLRDYFAGQALVAMMGGAQNPEQAAFFAYQVADEMLKERSK